MTTSSSSERRTVPTLGIPIHCPPPKTGLPTPFTHALPHPPFLSSTVNHQSRDSKNGPNPVPPCLRSTLSPKPRTGMMISKIRPTLLPVSQLHEITSGPSSQKSLSPRIGMTTSTLESSCHPRRTQHGTLWTRKMVRTLLTRRRTRPSPHILVWSLSASLLPRPPFPGFHFPQCLQERPSLALQPCLSFPFPPDATRLHTHLWRISPCVGVPLSPCYHRLLRYRNCVGCIP
ncbi:hypothetical protein EDB85DRAFT_1267464 [Lactarius pseudohatsudake]|nr:hypothetical protein EDB85DRAFT_1267464 [Lactarius pseudohatsudake]